MRAVVLALMVPAVLVLRPLDANAADRASESEEAQFDALVKQGDQAAAQWRLQDAAKAYAAALRIHDDPTIRGRLGLLALDLGDDTTGAHKLLEALEAGAGVGPEERARFNEAYAEARAKICRLDISTTAGAEVRLDGETITEKARADFFTFVLPGEHEIHASLPGYIERKETVIAPKGSRVLVRIELAPLPIPDPEELARKVLPRLAGSNSPPTAAGGNASRPRVMVGAGVGAVWGSSPGFAGAPLAFGAVRWDAFSLGADVRGAWSIARLRKYPSLFPWSWSITVPACYHRPVVFLCALAQVEGNGFTFASSFQNVAAGVGVRGGAEVLSGPLHVRLWGDALLRAPAPSLAGDREDGGRVVVWQGLPFGAAAGVSLGTTF